MKSERIGVSKALSLLINCECSHESCDCKEELQMLSRTVLPKEEWEMPKPPKILPLEKRSSIEIYKEKLSLSDMHVARNISDSAVCQSYQQEHEPDGKDDDESESLSADRQSNIHPPSIANDEQAEMEETESSLSGKKTVSLLIPGCKRGEEDYDCVIVGEINK
ncbi:unnamed protein product [Acanthoscelides obtectus]|uniref:Uncharacterized protein n=1 Tax=Acanthoscelides obtectus TaxID=200917 RepID=A0A9P0MH84_ACAOB|nr:unnamed protein product [Acanthoscelides obtectus]CAK1672138.1 hypothetical protein AOBTE_LOCUS28672 [Acanthoscelides obtectus]